MVSNNYEFVNFHFGYFRTAAVVMSRDMGVHLMDTTGEKVHAWPLGACYANSHKPTNKKWKFHPKSQKSTTNHHSHALIN